MTTAIKTAIVETRTVDGEYGFSRECAIVDHQTHGRLYLEQGFGGMDSIAGGCMRWIHGRVVQLLAADTFESLDDPGPELAGFDDYVGPETDLEFALAGVDPQRPILCWKGRVIANFAKSVGL